MAAGSSFAMPTWWAQRLGRSSDFPPQRTFRLPAGYERAAPARLFDSVVVGSMMAATSS